jgi:hypothetical protein
MSGAITDDLLDQYRRSFGMIRSELARLSEEQWIAGAPSFLSPVVLTMHTLDCLDYYFVEDAEQEYRWGHRFGGGWWELPIERLPDRASAGAYLAELEARVATRLRSLTDKELASPFPIADGSGKTWLGHYVYGLRHTTHHMGELAAISARLGNDAGSWE